MALRPENVSLSGKVNCGLCQSAQVAPGEDRGLGGLNNRSFPQCSGGWRSKISTVRAGFCRDSPWLSLCVSWPFPGACVFLVSLLPRTPVLSHMSPIAIFLISHLSVMVWGKGGEAVASNHYQLKAHKTECRPLQPLSTAFI